jgi:NADH-quinone oxidoreductase subunit A
MQELLSIAVFLGFGLVFVAVNLTLGQLVRPHLPNPDKLAIYECGEVPLGDSWVQFDLRFYIVALFYLIFDVEIALIYPWAIVFREMPMEAIVLGAPFLGVIVIGYAYEWHTGSLEWVRSVVSTSRTAGKSSQGAASATLSRMARRDPNLMEEPASA